MADKKKEQYEGDKFNTQSLMEAYNQVAFNEANTEFAEEYQKNTGESQFANEGLIFTNQQAVDSYREGTIDAHIEQSKNGQNEIPRKGYKK